MIQVSSLNAAITLINARLNWRHPYLGHNIVRSVNPKQVVNHLLEHKYCGIANGRASLDQDPR